MHTLTLQFWLFWLMVFGSAIVGILLGVALVLRYPPKSLADQSRFFVTCYLELNEGSSTYRSYLVDVSGEYPSAKDLKSFCDSVVKNSKEITSCTIISMNRLIK